MIVFFFSFAFMLYSFTWYSCQYPSHPYLCTLLFFLHTPPPSKTLELNHSKCLLIRCLYLLSSVWSIHTIVQIHATRNVWFQSQPNSQNYPEILLCAFSSLSVPFSSVASSGSPLFSNSLPYLVSCHSWQHVLPADRRKDRSENRIFSIPASKFKIWSISTSTICLSSCSSGRCICPPSLLPQSVLSTTSLMSSRTALLMVSSLLCLQSPT